MVAADQRSDVTADTQGKVINVMVERGQRVKMGQPVVQLDVRTAALAAREAQANLAAARAQKQLAEEECKRTQVAARQGRDHPQSEYDRQMTQCTSALQQVARRRRAADDDREVGRRRSRSRAVRRRGRREDGLARASGSRRASRCSRSSTTIR